MVKALMKLGIEGMYLNIMKAMYDKPISNIILNGGKTEIIFPKVRSETRGHQAYSTVWEFLATAMRQENEIKETQKGKEKMKLSLFVDHMILYLKDPENSIKNSKTL
jgi:hypothetical protein